MRRRKEEVEPCPIGRRPWKLGRNWKSTNENPPVYGERYV